MKWMLGIYAALVSFSAWGMPITIEVNKVPLVCAQWTLSMDASSAKGVFSNCEDGGTVDPPPVTSDPGKGLWTPPNKPNVTVFDLASTAPSPWTSNRTYVPGCMAGPNGNPPPCRYTGSMKWQKIYSARVPFSNGAKQLNLARAEAGEDHSLARASISTTPGDLLPPGANCRAAATSQPYLTVVDQAFFDSQWIEFGDYKFNYYEHACIVPKDTLLYLNITPGGTGADSCGKGSICRTQINEL